MPIKPENKHRYPKNWKQISERIRYGRAKNKCEQCGIQNHAYGYRTKDGTFHQVSNDSLEALAATVDGYKIIRIILTVAHLNHQPEDNREENLKALCQRCHNRHDVPHRRKTRAGRRPRDMPLFQVKQ
jgi:5-methylcytosine-specific restriction endonuclease McrA